MLKAGPFGGFKSAQDGGKLSHAGDFMITFGPERVEADVQPVNASLAERRSQLRQENAVGRDAKLLKARKPAQHPAKLRDAAPYQRLAAGHAHLAHAQRDGGCRHVAQLLERTDLMMRALRNTVLRHTVDAAQIAQIGHGQAQI